MRLPAAVALLVAVAASLVGCGSSESESDRVRATLHDYARATATRDVQAICDRLLAPKLVAETAAHGLACELVFRRALADVRDPRLDVRSVEVDGPQALARVHSTARGQPPSDDTILLTKVGKGWRVARLSQPQPQPVRPVGP